MSTALRGRSSAAAVGACRGERGQGAYDRWQGMLLDDERMMAVARQCHLTLQIAISKHMAFMKRWRLALQTIRSAGFMSHLRLQGLTHWRLVCCIYPPPLRSPSHLQATSVCTTSTTMARHRSIPSFVPLTANTLPFLFPALQPPLLFPLLLVACRPPSHCLGARPVVSALELACARETVCECV